MMHRRLIIFILGFLIPLLSAAQSSNSRYTVNIEIGNAYVSGICIMHEQEDAVTVSIMNEFGISALSYRYDRHRDRIKIISMVRQLRKPGMKRVLKSDLKVIMKSISKSENLTHENRRYSIKYHFAPLNNETD